MTRAKAAPAKAISLKKRPPKEAISGIGTADYRSEASLVTLMRLDILATMKDCRKE